MCQIRFLLHELKFTYSQLLYIKAPLLSFPSVLSSAELTFNEYFGGLLPVQLYASCECIPANFIGTSCWLRKVKDIADFIGPKNVLVQKQRCLSLWIRQMCDDSIYARRAQMLNRNRSGLVYIITNRAENWFCSVLRTSLISHFTSVIHLNLLWMHSSKSYWHMILIEENERYHIFHSKLILLVQK